MLPGVHRVRIKLAGGFGEYWYAWRGGPRILAVRGKTEAEIRWRVDAAFTAAAAAYEREVRPPPAGDFLSGLISNYLASPAYTKLSDRSRADLRRLLDVAKSDLGEMPIEALKSDGARKELLEWRDGFSRTPKTADARLDALARVLSWAKRKGDIPVNPLEKWPRLYAVNRAAIIWTASDLSRLLRGADADFRRAVLLAAFTGLRLGDLVRLQWSDVGEKALTLTTAKTNRLVVVPILPPARAILRQIGRKDVGAVLTHSRGKPWTGWGLQTAMQRTKTARGVVGLRFHDLRGTAATRFIRAGLPLADVAMIMGWTPDKTEQIAKRYVTSEALAAGMLKRIERNKSGAGL